MDTFNGFYAEAADAALGDNKALLNEDHSANVAFWHEEVTGRTLRMTGVKCSRFPAAQFKRLVRQGLLRKDAYGLCGGVDIYAP